MKSSDNLGLFGTLIGAAAASGNIATVPDTQATSGDGTASIALGFPPETFIDRAAGGEPPRGQDMNGFLNRISRAIQVLQAGYFGPFNSIFAAAIGGYPSGAVVSGSVVGTFWVSTADNNTTTPGASGATWQNLFSGYLPLTGGTLTGDTTIKGLTSWSTTGSYTSNGLILSGQNGNIVTLRQNETTGQFTQLAIQVNGYNSVNGYFSLRNDGTFWSGTTQFADRTWAMGQFVNKASSSGDTMAGPLTIRNAKTTTTTGQYNYTPALCLANTNGVQAYVFGQDQVNTESQITFRLAYNGTDIGYWWLNQNGGITSSIKGDVLFASDAAALYATFAYAQGTVGSSGNDWFWMKLPNGWILQGGNASYYAADGTTGTTIKLPTSFGAQFVIAIGNDIGSNANAVTVMRIDASTIRLLGREVTGGTLSNTTINYLCVGTAP
ncbi:MULTISPECIES: hypothetical protein [Acetobacter]|uniref:Tail fiber protein n=1 Tax=Acetobacter tropicalis TaxID=104102 RepID=A0A291PJ62_9PROT|nr:MULTISPECIES: hypothetical protein [Acetobacter]ATJ91520.1 hypothetical protein CIW82_13280 [Acetobacter tropicalis]